MNQTWETEQAATAEARLAALGQFPPNCKGDHGQYLISQGGNWLARNCMEEGNFVLVNRDGTRQWNITYQELLEPYRSAAYDIHVTSVWPYHWSRDTRYLYFFINDDAPSVDMIPDYLILEFMPPQTRTLYRIDTQSGSWGIFVREANSYSFSPTDRSLVYVYRNVLVSCKVDLCPVEMTILDFWTGETRRFSLGDALAAGYIVWSGDGKSFFFSTIHNYQRQSDRLLFDFTIYEMNIDTGSLVALQSYLDSNVLVYPVALTEDNRLVIQLESYDGNNTIEKQYLDLETKQLITPSITP